jgi:NAD(P)-dependent dehydrogenase (short-subunit alcohol dehydrogenase family)
MGVNVMDEFVGRTAVITGGGSGIGRGMAIAFAREGMNIVVADIEAAPAEAVAGEVRALGVRALAVPADVTDLTSVQALAAAAVAEFGTVEVLCNNAGISVGVRGMHARHEDWIWVLGVNLWGVIHGVEAFLPGMLAHGGECHIVNTSSMNGILPSARSAMYSTSKYGVLGLTETLANELQGTNVGISALCPAAVSTRIFDSERNRPPSLTPSDPPPPHTPSARFDISAALDPVEVGELVLLGMRCKQLHIFTDMKVKPLIEAHHARMLAEFDVLAEWEAGRSTG